MPSSLKKTLLIGLFAIVAVLGTATLAFAAPTIQPGDGWNVHHGSYPGYCLNCHSGFAVKAPAITSGVKPTHGDRGSTCTQCHVVNAPAPVLPAGPKPTVAYVKVSNPVAYDILSKQKTKFSTSVDTPSYAELTVATTKGTKTIYKGLVNTANQNFDFPLWNGMAPDGTRLPSSSYAWTLKMSTQGGTTTSTGKIIVCKVYFTMSGTSAAGAKKIHTGYMKAGTANIYMAGSTTAASDRLTSNVFRGTTFRKAVGAWSFGSATPLNVTAYLRSTSNIPSPGLTSFDFTGVSNVTYNATVVQ